MSPDRAIAQETGAFAVAGGYAFLGSSEIVDGYAAGWLVEGAWNATSWFAAAVELSRNTQQQDVGLLLVDARFLALHAGPRVAVPLGRVRPFGQLLFGQTGVDLRVRSTLPPGSTGDADDRRFSWQVGGGVDVSLDGPFRIRLAFDHRRVSTSDPLTQRRVSTTVVYSFP